MAIEKRYFHVIKQHFAEGLFEKTLSYDQAKEIAMLVMSHVDPNERRQREQQELAPPQKELPAPTLGGSSFLLKGAPEILPPVKERDTGIRQPLEIARQSGWPYIDNGDGTATMMDT